MSTLFCCEAADEAVNSMTEHFPLAATLSPLIDRIV